MVRAFLYRAEALLVGHQGRHREAAKLLRRALEKLTVRYPDDAFFTAIDLMIAYVKSGQEGRAVKMCALILELNEAIPLKIHPEGLTITRFALERGTLSERQAVELRSLLRRV